MPNNITRHCLETEIDGSGKDISRGYFISYDPEAYLNTTLQQQIEPLAVHIIAPEKGAKKLPVRKPDRHRGVSPHRSFSPARSRALGETAILQSGDRRKTQHEIQKGKP